MPTVERGGEITAVAPTISPPCPSRLVFRSRNGLEVRERHVVVRTRVLCTGDGLDTIATFPCGKYIMTKSPPFPIPAAPPPCLRASPCVDLPAAFHCPPDTPKGGFFEPTLPFHPT